MNCKDCVHYELCFDYTHLKHSKNLPDNREDVCEHFKNKASFVEVPCKVGDTVYKVVNDKRVKSPYECKVVGFWYSEYESCNSLHLVRYVNDVFNCSFSVPFTDFGKTVFLTKEDAEKKLRKEDGKNG